jgi:XTP/dITP diphosphohydrolase
MPTLVVATHNRHKTEEIRTMIGEHFDEVTDLATLAEQHGGDAAPEPEETEETFEGNSRLKAEAAAQAPAIVSMGKGKDREVWILADDSGIEVDALDGRPGVYSARFAGENASDADNREHLLSELRAAGATQAKQRSGRFRCVLALIRDGEFAGTFDGAVEGTVTPTVRGDGGFGYDPLFQPEGYAQTFGELPAETKHQLSHRGRALEKLRAWLAKP